MQDNKWFSILVLFTLSSVVTRLFKMFSFSGYGINKLQIMCVVEDEKVR